MNTFATSLTKQTLLFIEYNGNGSNGFALLHQQTLHST